MIIFVKYFKILFFTLIFIGTLSAFAKTPRKNQRLISHAKFVKLKLYQQVLIVKELRRLFVDLEAIQGGYKHSNAQFNALPLLDLLLPKANAVEKGDPCIHAGFLKSYHIVEGAALCRPPDETDGSCSNNGQLPCNPLIFGEGVCANKDQRITELCDADARTPDQVVEYIKKNGKDWNELTKELAQFCNTSQRWECTIVNRRLNEIKAKLNEGSSASQPGTAATESKGSGAQASPPTGNSPTNGDGSDCVTSDLVDRPFVQYDYKLRPQYEAKYGKYVLAPDVAQSLMCRPELSINNEAIDDAKKRLDKAIADDRNSQHDKELNSLRTNLDNCVREAKVLRRHKNLNNIKYDIKATAWSTSYGHDIRQTRFNRTTTTGILGPLGSGIYAEGLHLCQIRFVSSPPPRSQDSTGGTR